MDGEFRFDMAAISQGIRSAEVVVIYLPLVRKTLLMDFRHDDTAGPFVRLVPMANTVEERFQSLKRLRPRFPRPESLVLIPWPRYAASLKTLGILDQVNARLEKEGYPALGDELARCHGELVQAERAEVLNAIRGDNYQSLWEARDESES